MKITDVKTFLVRDEERPGRNYSFVKVYTDEGLTGLGEAGISGKELALQGLVETYRPILVGMDPSRIEHIWQTLWRGQFFRGGHVHSATVAAIDLALWDLRGKALGVPVYDLLGGRTASTRGAIATSTPAGPAAAPGPASTRWSNAPSPGWRRVGASSASRLERVYSRPRGEGSSRPQRCDGRLTPLGRCVTRWGLRSNLPRLPPTDHASLRGAVVA